LGSKLLGRETVYLIRKLVTKGEAFYNPINTAAAAVVSFTRGPGTHPPKINGYTFRERVLEN
jgi:hypothetical protein